MNAGARPSGLVQWRRVEPQLPEVGGERVDQFPRLLRVAVLHKPCDDEQPSLLRNLDGITGGSQPLLKFSKAAIGQEVRVKNTTFLALGDLSEALKQCFLVFPKRSTREKSSGRKTTGDDFKRDPGGDSFDRRPRAIVGRAAQDISENRFPFGDFL